MSRPSIADLLAGRPAQPPSPAPSAPSLAPNEPAGGLESFERSVRDLDDLDLFDLEPAFADRGWLIAAPACGPCERHGHGWWWEEKATGLLHCVACWPQGPTRSFVRRIWRSEAATAEILPHFRVEVGDSLFWRRPEHAWPWPETNPQPAEAF